jgi:hypothetical protein
MSTPNVRPIQVFIGGGVAVVILLVVSEAGSGGAQLAEGLAVITMVSSILLWGTPVFDYLSKLFGSSPTGTTGTTTSGGSAFGGTIGNIGQAVAAANPGTPPTTGAKA